jgi:hypothetical protein
VHTETSTENGTTSDQHAASSGKGVDERAGDRDDGADSKQIRRPHRSLIHDAIDGVMILADAISLWHHTRPRSGTYAGRRTQR